MGTKTDDVLSEASATDDVSALERELSYGTDDALSEASTTNSADDRVPAERQRSRAHPWESALGTNSSRGNIGKSRGHRKRMRFSEDQKTIMHELLKRRAYMGIAYYTPDDERELCKSLKLGLEQVFFFLRPFSG